MPQIKWCTLGVYWVYTSAVGAELWRRGGTRRDGQTVDLAGSIRARLELKGCTSLARAPTALVLSPPRSTRRARIHARTPYSYRTAVLAERAPRAYMWTHSCRSSQIRRPGAAAFGEILITRASLTAPQFLVPLHLALCRPSSAARVETREQPPSRYFPCSRFGEWCSTRLSNKIHSQAIIGSPGKLRPRAFRVVTA